MVGVVCELKGMGRGRPVQRMEAGGTVGPAFWHGIVLKSQAKPTKKKTAPLCILGGCGPHGEAFPKLMVLVGSLAFFLLDSKMAGPGCKMPQQP